MAAFVQLACCGCRLVHPGCKYKNRQDKVVRLQGIFHPGYPQNHFLVTGHWHVCECVHLCVPVFLQEMGVFVLKICTFVA